MPAQAARTWQIVTHVGIVLAAGRVHFGRPNNTSVSYVLLAFAPDFDYLVNWLLNINSAPRWTHSLLFALVASVLVWRALLLSGSTARTIAWPVLMAAACSHMLLGLRVGVHPVPVLWPGPQWTSACCPAPGASMLAISTSGVTC